MEKLIFIYCLHIGGQALRYHNQSKDLMHGNKYDLNANRINFTQGRLLFEIVMLRVLNIQTQIYTQF